jgi:hypothetical protein
MHCTYNVQHSMLFAIDQQLCCHSQAYMHVYVSITLHILGIRCYSCFFFFFSKASSVVVVQLQAAA